MVSSCPFAFCPFSSIKWYSLQNSGDESLLLAQCLRDKGLNIPDPTQDDPKLNLSEAGEDREIIKEYLEECEPERTASRTDK